MKLSFLAISVIKGSTQIKEAIRNEMQVSNSTLWRWIDENKENGDLTKASVIDIIKNISGLQRQQIIKDGTNISPFINGRN